MSTPVRLLGFLTIALVVFGAAAGIGKAVGPVDTDTGSHGHTEEAEGHGGHGDEGDPRRRSPGASPSAARVTRSSSPPSPPPPGRLVSSPSPSLTLTAIRSPTTTSCTRSSCT
ncbi:hypothetical protein [Nocardioides alcanivorans]|uniref:hypothetical protein n=1 Tax=Nocardioides alcanivorans TaxID=2897352 RepID=UPI001F2646B1|nr:hypothetical protein [Nocardioides alcanivorans]